MRKLCSLISALLLLAGLLAACSGHNLPSLSESKKQKIDEAWNAKYNAHIQWNDPVPRATDGMRYYGTYDGYDILYLSGQELWASGIQIGNNSFCSLTDFVLYAHKDGEIRRLSGVYNDGLIGDESIAKVGKVHQEYSQLIYSFSDYYGSIFKWWR